MGLEILEDLPDADVIVVPVGGGPISGIAAAVRRVRPSARVIGVEREGAPTVTNALRAGRPVRLERVATMADGLRRRSPASGPLPVHALVNEVVLVSDGEIAAGVRAVLEYAKLLAERAEAAGVAALLAGRVAVAADARGGRS